MNRLDRYLMRHVFELTGLVALALLSIYSFVTFVADLGDTGSGGFGLLQLVEYTLLMTPTSLYILMPIVALLGTLLGLGQLARQSELTAMRAAGVSLRRMGLAVLFAGAVLGVLTLLLGDWLAPGGQSLASALRSGDRGQAAIATSVWLRNGPNMIRIGRVLSENDVQDVDIYRLGDDGALTASLTAQKGHFTGDHWQLLDVRQTQFTDTRTVVTQLPTLDVGGALDPGLLHLLILQADNLSFRGLSRLIDYLHSNHLDAANYELLYWRKLVEPLTVMAMMVFAIPFVLGRLRDSGAGQRLLIGVLIGIVFYVLNKVSLSYGKIYQLPAPIAAGTPTLLLGALAFWRLSRAK